MRLARRGRNRELSAILLVELLHRSRPKIARRFRVRFVFRLDPERRRPRNDFDPRCLVWGLKPASLEYTPLLLTTFGKPNTRQCGESQLIAAAPRLFFICVFRLSIRH